MTEEDIRRTTLPRKYALLLGPLNVWLNVEYGFLLMAMGKESSAQAYFQRTADFLSSRQASRGYIINQFYERSWLLFGQLAGNTKFDLDEFETDVSGVSRTSPHIFNRIAGPRALAALYRNNGNLKLEIDQLEKATALIQIQDQAWPTHYLDDRLVEVYLQAMQLDRGREHFRSLVGKFDDSLVERHPKRAFLRINLAKILLGMENQGAEAGQVLREAQQILANHDGVPVHVTDEITQLLEAADEASS